MCTEVRYGQRGVTLIELVMFIVIVSVGIAGILGVLNVTSRSSADPVAPKQALAIAEALLEEIELAAFTWCDPDDANVASATSAAGCATLPEGLGAEAGDARPYDNVNDYHQPVATAVSDIAGTAIPGLGAYSYTVAVAPAALGTITAASGDALRITVSVVGPGGTSVSLDGYRTRHSPNAAP
jgi:MSHA pilin protein MshD